MRRRATLISMLLLPLTATAPSALAQDKGAAAAPRLDYRMDGYRDEQLTHDSRGEDYRGRWVGTWYGADGTTYSGTYEGGFDANGLPAPTSAPAPHTEPDPAYIGSGKIVNGWYYPPPVVTTTVTEYAPAR